MNGKPINIHWSFWLIGTMALVWTGMEMTDFLMQMNSDMLILYSESERMIIEGRPFWATVSFAIAVFTGMLGGFLLLLTKSRSYKFFVASLVAVLITQTSVLVADVEFSLVELAGIVLMPILVAAFLVWYTKLALNKHWLN
jgi:hypothetical protein